nr:MAG TPA: hypothetical protein [Caudoviricetes sp.]
MNSPDFIRLTNHTVPCFYIHSTFKLKISFHYPNQVKRLFL